MESSLTLTMKQLKSEVAAFLGWGRGPDYGEPAWDARKTASLNATMNSGLRNFYYPSPMPGETQSYDWSFLRPTKQIALPQGEYLIDLPDDFGGLEGEIRLVDSGRRAMAIKQSSEQVVRQQIYNFPSQTGQPEVVAIVLPTKTDASKGQRSQLLVFPTADIAYVLEFQYYILPDSLSDSFPFTLGGATHSQTVLASCLAAAELFLNNERGPMYMEFVNRMSASISLDRRNKAQSFGMNDDPSFNAGTRYNRPYSPFNVPITYNGVTPG
jgi:hypothetical protein